MRILLGGGGAAVDDRPLNEVLSRWIGPAGRLLYWPIALRGIRTFDSCLEWIHSTLGPLGITNISMWTQLPGHQKEELDAFDAVYIGGGNTFSLLAEMRASGFDRYLTDFAGHGQPVYGGSAGAAVLGRDIRTVEHMDHNLVGLQDTTGLDLAWGYAVWVHYTPADDELIYRHVREFKYPVLALSERAGMVIDEAGMHSGGFEPALRFDARGKAEF